MDVVQHPIIATGTAIRVNGMWVTTDSTIVSFRVTYDPAGAKIFGTDTDARAWITRGGEFAKIAAIAKQRIGVLDIGESVDGEPGFTVRIDGARVKQGSTIRLPLPKDWWEREIWFKRRNRAAEWIARAYAYAAGMHWPPTP